MLTGRTVHRFKVSHVADKKVRQRHWKDGEEKEWRKGRGEKMPSGLQSKRT